MRRNWKRILATVLALALAVPASACKKKRPKDEVIKESDTYFTASEKELVINSDPDKKILMSNVDNARIVGNTIVANYTLLYEYPPDVMKWLDEEVDPDSEIAIEIENMWNDYYQTGVAFFDFDGNMKNIIEIPDSMQVVTIDEGLDNEIIVLLETLDYSYDGANYYIRTYDENAALLDSISVSENLDSWYSSVFATEDGKYILVGYADIVVLTSNGYVEGRLQDEMLQESLFRSGDKYYVMSYLSNESNLEVKAYLQELDTDSVVMVGDRIDVDLRLSESYSNSQGECYLITGNGIEKVDILSGKSEEFLNWDNTDVNYGNIDRDSLRILSDDKVAFIRSSWEAANENETWIGKTYVTVLTRAEKNPHAGKTYIEMGVIGTLGEEVQEYILRYNNAEGNPARVRVHDYTASSAMVTGSSQYLSDVSEQVYLDMLSGNGPDILVDFSGYSQFNSEEVLVDLNTYVDGESGLNRDEYFDNVLSAFETKDKLFQIPVCFDIRGLMGNEILIGERSGWTYSEFFQIVETLDPDVTVMEEMRYNELLYELLSNAMDSFIDYSRKEVYFDGDEFKQLLQIVKEYGVETVHDSYDYVDSYEYFPNSFYGPREKMDEGILALTDTYIYSLEQYAENASICNGKVIYVGMPSPEGTGMSAAPMLTMAISAFSKKKDEAWNFIRQMFDEDAQYDLTNSFSSIPLNRKAFDKINDEAISRNAQQIRDLIENGWDTEEMITPITQAHKEGFLKLVESVSTIMSSDPAVIAIIEEETAGYFAGQRELDEVCANIQKRTTIIVNER
ncbi:MAG: extracellular solute-binding protein [Clostridiales bacterium]|nr:extracellular solute-binding protein [Clostridiales bacterium]